VVVTCKVVDVVEARAVVVVDEARTTAFLVVVVDSSVDEVDDPGNVEELVVDRSSTIGTVLIALPAAVATLTSWLADEQLAKNAGAAQSTTAVAHLRVARQRFIGTSASTRPWRSPPTRFKVRQTAPKCR
jgi:hypothetical protein